MILYPWIVVCWLLAGVLEVCPQSFTISYHLGDSYRIVEKHNFRKWENGKYLGAVYREIRGALKREREASEARFSGRFYLLEQTHQGGLPTTPIIEASFPAEVLVTEYGIILSSSVERFPTMRKFPILPKESEVGVRWQEMAERVLDPDFNGKVTVLPVLVDYRYEGLGTYRNEEGHRIVGKYAVRYKGTSGGSKDPDLTAVKGTHDVVIFLSKREGGLRFMTETFKEEYEYRAGRSLRLEGTVVTFFEGVPPVDSTRVVEIFKVPQDAPTVPPKTIPPKDPDSIPHTQTIPFSTPTSPSTSVLLELDQGEVPSQPKLSHVSPELPLSPRVLPDVEWKDKPEGLTLTVKNLRFKPDSAELLPEENARLFALAQGLKQIQNKRFLVVGHTADVGNP
ncbi:MAG: hypothetical protein N2442_00575, partial [Spirochaetes bacterium]|nr:hypothetical protein [Spirochaetota bacterium]